MCDYTTCADEPEAAGGTEWDHQTGGGSELERCQVIGQRHRTLGMVLVLALSLSLSLVYYFTFSARLF